jgi:photosystem II stability/assembly factor-like uncharacterized protein
VKSRKYMINRQSLLRLIHKFNLILLIIATVFCLGSNPAFAHRPHDVISQVEVSPDFQTDNTVYILVRNNLYKSTDGGNNWTRQIKGLDYTGELSSLSVSPLNKNILYLGSRSNGIYKSEDAGESWQKINKGLETDFINLLETAPSDPNTVAAVGLEKGVYLTKDGGKNWSNVFPTTALITSLAITPNNPDRIFFGDDQGKLYTSSDGGKTWQNLSLPADVGAVDTMAFSPNLDSDKTFFVGTKEAGVFKTVDDGKTFQAVNEGIKDKIIEDIVISPQYAQNSTLYAITWYDGMYISQDGGKSWTKMSEGLTKDKQGDDYKVPHFMDLKVVKDTMFLGGFNGLFKTTDGGKQWQEIETLARGTVIAMAVSPNYAQDSTVVIANYVGNIFISRDKGKTWTPINRGLEVYRLGKDPEESGQDPRRFFDIAFSPNYGKDRTIFAGFLRNRFAKSDQGGDLWKIIEIDRRVRGPRIVPSPDFANDKTLFLTNQEGRIFRSTDGGNTVKNISEVGRIFGNYAPSMVASPDFAKDKTLFVTGKQGIYQSVDGGITWKNITQGTPLSKTSNVQLAMSPDYPRDGTMFAGAISGLFVTRDGAKSWTKLEQPGFNPNSAVETISISPDYAKDRTVIASLQGEGLFKSTDGGETFKSIGDPKIPLVKIHSIPSSGIPVRFSPNYAQDKTLFGFGGAQTTVFRSTDGGETWTSVTIPPHAEENTTRYKIGEFFSGPIGTIWRLVVPILLAILAYFLVGFLKLEKIINLPKTFFRMAGAFMIFLFIFFIIITQV